MSLVLPFVPSVPFYRFGCAIEGDQYIFDVRWNARDEAWYFDVREGDETIIGIGIKVALGAYMGRTINHKLFRNGVIVADDTSGSRTAPGFDDFGTRVLIKRFDLGEIFALAPKHV